MGRYASLAAQQMIKDGIYKEDYVIDPTGDRLEVSLDIKYNTETKTLIVEVTKAPDQNMVGRSFEQYMPNILDWDDFASDCCDVILDEKNQKILDNWEPSGFN